MRTVHNELVILMQRRMDYVRIIASLKFILKKPVYAPAVEKEQCQYLIGIASQLGLNVSLVRSFMRLLYKISREVQRKMHGGWSLDQSACTRFLLSQANHLPMLQLNILKNKLNHLDTHALLFCEQLIHLLRFFIRFIDTQIISLFSSLTENCSLIFIKEKFGHELPNDSLLYKLFLLINGFVKKEELCC